MRRVLSFCLSGGHSRGHGISTLVDAERRDDKGRNNREADELRFPLESPHVEEVLVQVGVRNSRDRAWNKRVLANGS